MWLWDGKYQNRRDRCQPAGLDLVDRLLAWVAPRRCCLCRQPAAGMDLCIECLHDLPWLGQSCSYCAATLPEGGICGQCMAAPPPQAFTLAALKYQFPLARLITGLKYRRQQALARVLGELLAVGVLEAAHAGRLTWPDCIVPVPLHPWRQFRRGYNQAELLARTVARDIRRPVAIGWLKRVRNTPSQTSLSGSARRRNMRNSIVATPMVAGRHIAIVDDVITTGATVSECARVLTRAGAARVQVWSVTRK